MNTDATPLLSIEGLSVALPAWADRRTAVEDLSLQLQADEVLCVVGESGSGKSMMAKSVMGLLAAPHVRIAAGSIRFEGEDLVRVSPERLRAIRGNGIGMVFQEPMTALNPLMTIGQQIEETLATHVQLTKQQSLEKMSALMLEVGLPDAARILGSYPHQLSGGQRQRAMIVMALILEPRILIADEPTTALDVTTQAQILVLIKALQKKRQTGVLFITHDFGVVAEIADRVAVMQSGRLVEIGTAEQVLRDPQHPYTRALIAAVPSMHKAVPRPDNTQAVVLEVKGLDKTYGKSGSWFGLGKARAIKPALASVDLQLKKGEILGLVGESGSGKSTLARCITRLVDADSGSIVLEGRELAQLGRRQLRPLRSRIQMIFQDPYASLNPRLPVAELIAQGPIANGVPRQQALREAAELLAVVQLDPSAAGRFPHEFSGGQRQRIGIARALAMKPAVIVADEPVSALDVSVQKKILELLAEIRESRGVAMLFVTHDLRVAAQLCDSLAVMHQGRIVEQGRTAALFAAPQHAYTKSLLGAVPGRSWSLNADRPETPAEAVAAAA
ncbi:dipeptide ABC transporter ATP-binding protein [Xylophilus rhododendri]|uniref:Dipeptide ABC transporter ATP-binding protein n=1 Tax=Xylophilus rhododendri TaxID=2697032 RepID=A0A857J8N7_9BURK|nr:ABC transporter ATP-binding protein [Xylophilus rhododendri]QHJ00411.1 dipeptide ABC transporter ATP-binding protein [Xylophilus rhododendri]